MIREALLSDIPAIVALGGVMPELEVLAGAGFATDAELEAHFQRRGTRLVALDATRQIVGFALGSFGDPDAPVVPYACLVYVAVRADLRGTGVGRSLVQACCMGLRAQGADVVYAWARADAPIETLLTSEGFSAGHLYRWMEIHV